MSWWTIKKNDPIGAEQKMVGPLVLYSTIPSRGKLSPQKFFFKPFTALVSVQAFHCHHKSFEIFCNLFHLVASPFAE
jgi:hypothetical protein